MILVDGADSARAHVGDADGVGLRRWRRWVLGVYAVMMVSLLGGMALAFASAHPRPGHPRNVAALVVIFGGAALLPTIVAAVCWRLMATHGSTRRVMRADWVTRRRVGTDLRKGRSIQPRDRDTARALVELYRDRGWLVWFYLSLGGLWLVEAVFNHGALRWLQVTLSVAYLALAPYWLRQRKQILSRASEVEPTLDEPSAAV